MRKQAARRLVTKDEGFTKSHILVHSLEPMLQFSLVSAATDRDHCLCLDGKVSMLKCLVEGVVTEVKVDNTPSGASTPTTGTPTSASHPFETTAPSAQSPASPLDPAAAHPNATNEKADKKKPTRKVKVLRKIPPKVIANAKGLVIFTSFRTGIAPFGGAGGSGVVVAKLPDGNVYDAVLVINSQQALDSFRTHKATLGAELAVVAGPYGAGASVEAGAEKQPIFAYVKSKGVYAGVEVVAQVFVERFDENAAMYHWPGIKAGDILAGKVKPPNEAVNLIRALQDAETGRAQAETNDAALDVVVATDGSASPVPGRRMPPPFGQSPGPAFGSEPIPGVSTVQLEDGEVLHLPPPPSMTSGDEKGAEAVHQPSSVAHAQLAGQEVSQPQELPTRASTIAETPSTISQPAIDPFLQHQETHDRGIEEDGPPQYEEHVPGYSQPAVGHPGAAVDANGYPLEKQAAPQSSTPSGALTGEGSSSYTAQAPVAPPQHWNPQQPGGVEQMDETERREWEQWQEMQREEAQRQHLGGDGQGVDGVTSGIQRVDIGDGSSSNPAGRQ